MSIQRKISTLVVILLVAVCFQLSGQSEMVLRTGWLFDGGQVRADWLIRIRDGMIGFAGLSKAYQLHPNIPVADLTECFVLPELIDAHTHLLLHPYEETAWNDPVLKESSAERLMRGASHARATLMTGFTAIRDLGSEGRDYNDLSLKQAIEKGICPWPRMLVAGRAIVVAGSCGPKGFAAHVAVPGAAPEADGPELVRVVRKQIGKSADIIKLYADDRWGPNSEAMATSSHEESEAAFAATASSGRVVVTHAGSAEGILRAAKAGVATNGHGDARNKEIYGAIIDNVVAFCPTLAAPESTLGYRGWNKDADSASKRIKTKQASFQLAMDMGATILMGGDAGDLDHGENTLEMELMVEYGMSAENVLRSATSVNAAKFSLHKVSRIASGLRADIVAIAANPFDDMAAVRSVVLIMQEGSVILDKSK